MSQPEPEKPEKRKRYPKIRNKPPRMGQGQGHLFKPSTQRQFEMFHAANPKIYELIVFYARQAKTAGRKSYGMQMIYERVRWHVHIEIKDYSDDFKLNNNYASRYARLVMEQEPDLEGFFEIRRLRVY